MEIVFFDTETTGNEPKDCLCQIAWKDANGMHSGLFKPPIPISFDSMAVHHITNKMIAGRPTFKDSPEWKEVKKSFESEDVIPIAHNALFDLGMLKKEEIVPKQFICTLRVARELDTDSKLPRYNLQYLRYALDLDVEGIAHSADGDVLVLEKLFDRLLGKIMEMEPDRDKAIQKMVDISARPTLIKTFNFGKHTGKSIGEVKAIAPDYLEWLLNEKLKTNPDDEDWIYTLKYHLGKLV